MADKFKPGDTVRLKSGGPLMTFVEYFDHNGERLCQCKWFDKNQHLEVNNFSEAEIQADNNQISFA